MNILLVDDDLDCLKAMQVMMEKMDHHCIAVDDPRDALEQCEQQSFDLIITDFQMPAMNGSELACKIRAKNPEAKIILITGYLPIAGSLPESPFSAILEKPVGIHELKGVLDGI